MRHATLAFALLAACGDGSPPNIVGAWQETGGAHRIWEYRADGTVEMRTEDGGFTMTGTWSWQEDGRLHYEVTGGAASTRGTHEVAVSGDTLTLTEGGISVELRRVP